MTTWPMNFRGSRWGSSVGISVIVSTDLSHSKFNHIDLINWRLRPCCGSQRFYRESRGGILLWILPPMGFGFYFTLFQSIWIAYQAKLYCFTSKEWILSRDSLDKSIQIYHIKIYWRWIPYSLFWRDRSLTRIGDLGGTSMLWIQTIFNDLKLALRI